MTKRILRLPVLLLACAPGLVACAPGLAAAQAAQVAQALGRVVARIEQVEHVKGKNLGVSDFPMTAGGTTELGTFLANQLEVALTGRTTQGASFKVLNRSHLCRVIRENKLWVDDRFDPELNSKLGKLGGADFLVTGLVTALSRDLAMTVQVIDTKTGGAVFADSLTLPLDEGFKGMLARAVVGDGCGGTPAATAAAPAPPGSVEGERLEVKIWTNKKVYRVGDTVQFGLRVNRDAYVTLVNIGTSGEVAIIYPNRFHPSHFVRGGQDVAIPPPDSGFTLTVQGPAGFDQIRAIATVEQVRVHASDFAGQATAFRSLDTVQTRNLVVGINAERERVAPAKWAEDVIAVEVRR